MSYDKIEFIINSIKLNLKQLEIERSCLDANNKLEKARSLQNKDLKKTADNLCLNIRSKIQKYCNQIPLYRLNKKIDN